MLVAQRSGCIARLTANLRRKSLANRLGNFADSLCKVVSTVVLCRGSSGESSSTDKSIYQGYVSHYNRQI